MPSNENENEPESPRTCLVCDESYPNVRFEDIDVRAAPVCTSCYPRAWNSERNIRRVWEHVRTLEPDEQSEALREFVELLDHGYPQECARYGCGTFHVAVHDEELGDHAGCQTCARCARHCSCTYCSHCSARRSSSDYCGSCEGCAHCCECAHCGECGDRYDSDDDGACPDCNHCGHCECSCRAVKFHERGLKFFAAPKNKFKVNSIKRFVAVEIEVSDVTEYDEGVKIERACEKWNASIVHDGSLPESGFEINTSPASGDLFIEQINDICSALDKAGAKTNATCGLHVHADARDYDYLALRRLIHIYAHIEDALFEMCEQSRKGSTYCIPCGKKFKRKIMGFDKSAEEGSYNIVRKRAIETIYETSFYDGKTHKDHQQLNRDIIDRKRNKYDGVRYKALNLHSYFYRKTVEIRMGHGSVVAHDVAMWALTWGRVMDFALTARDSDVRGLMELTPFEALISIAEGAGKGAANLVQFIMKRTQTYAPPRRTPPPVVAAPIPPPPSPSPVVVAPTIQPPPLFVRDMYNPELQPLIQPGLLSRLADTTRFNAEATFDLENRRISPYHLLPIEDIDFGEEE